jgi:DNA-binding response OmpR family regulator
MKIAIFENEYDTLEMAFNYANKKYYSNKLIYEIFPRSQDFNDLSLISNYGLIIIDIDLSAMSILDGFGLIKKIESTLQETPKILIMTGQALGPNYHLENGLKYKYPVLVKSVNYNKIKKEFDKLNIE